MSCESLADNNSDEGGTHWDKRDAILLQSLKKKNLEEEQEAETQQRLGGRISSNLKYTCFFGFSRYFRSPQRKKTKKNSEHIQHFSGGSAK